MILIRVQLQRVWLWGASVWFDIDNMDNMTNRKDKCFKIY